MGIFTVLGIAFIIVKVLGLLAWSWWWLPLIFLGDIILVLFAIFGFSIFAFILTYFSNKK